MCSDRELRSICILLLYAMFSLSATAVAQSSPVPQSSNDDEAELVTHDEATTFKVNVKLVLVRVVVRDAKGDAIGGLRREDFQLFDKGKPQVISQFDAETPETVPTVTPQSPEDPYAHRLGTLPARYIAYVFDDEHMELKDVTTVREAARRHFKNLQPNDRAGLFTTSGKQVLDFTDNLALLDAALAHIAPVAGSAAETPTCPDISYYMAYLIITKKDQEAIKTATQDYLQCSQINSARITRKQLTYGNGVAQAPERVATTAQAVLSQGDALGRQSLQTLEAVVRRVSVLPGQRSVVLVSPGFLTPAVASEYADLVDSALHAQTIINTIDARGLYALSPSGDAQKRVTLIDASPTETMMTDPSVYKSQYTAQAAAEQGNALSSLANETGGRYFHGNDFDSEFKRAAEAPEHSYLLAFAPKDLNADGSFHEIKVTVNGRDKVTVEARHGYYSPKKFSDPAEQAKQEMREALFSQEQMHDLPVEMKTQFFKPSDFDAKVTVMAHVDVKGLPFRKANGRNTDVLTCDTALFNSNGNLVQGLEKTITMRLKDDTLEHRLGSGITLKTGFNVKPGSYLVRVVVRDEEGRLMSAETRPLEIP